MRVEDCVRLAVKQLQSGVAARFASSPIATLEEEIGLTIKAVDHLSESRSEGGLCDGMSFLSDDIILYRNTGDRRQNFTLAHELGHWLVDQIDEIYDWLAEQDEAAKILETLCDRIAQELLIPNSIVVSSLRGNAISAQGLVDLIAATHASRPACAIALSARLPHAGAVVIIDRTKQTVIFSSVRPDPEQGWPSGVPWTGQAIPPGHPLAGLADNGLLRRRSYWLTPWGIRHEYYVDAVSDGRYIFAVFAVHDLWGAETLHFDDRQVYDERPTGEIHCCNKARTVRGYPCDECGRQFCPVCERCLCDQRAAREIACAGCFTLFHSNLIVDGLCIDCRE
ncbi:ImmA/IrrE family metallo-endopeptidase [Rhodococcus sp. BP-252]|uniref:ImmA/IrrE family metallo-endopeptidase n=1 Tax=unclassified Rhodococcus (in: high G+C Gram-positive bacteria) TaxID=192944 RepID=UPI001C9AC6EF|nr:MULTISPECIES: ImmA/IrrE family metallo-endopeptidase [unclassified Rhodococcus (in: high G+C Gram-positive bacteria)]MBY6413932.1 ImmA/IrrE family metallo-endopeptidase [Rhodococcus sp. BP-320]MBY6418618.1 ImmA/IrrE family metallo-endopeptidase [Rhodococcus sp. BP-321]MBY6422913.1 ImmA/IrrE family metallo-endopeptidase [Rhodococcus sp. BP-324]MBY6428738.1 ImmA/IrrE family metallo-endopeptidase [Rhodococcus sp. BP-323]MBY6433739.1 ImmA/IrrE family metallo-endopeptidase [Rhodococcus sp. BP-32